MSRLAKVATFLEPIQPSTLQEHEDLARIWAAGGSAGGHPCFTYERSGQEVKVSSTTSLVLAASFHLGAVEKCLARAGQATPTDSACVPVKKIKLATHCCMGLHLLKARDWPNFNILHAPETLISIDKAIAEAANASVNSRAREDWLEVETA